MASIAGSTVQFEIEGEKAAGETSKSRKKSCLPSLLSLLCLAFAILLAVFIVLYIKESGKKAEKVPGFRESVGR